MPKHAGGRRSVLPLIDRKAGTSNLPRSFEEHVDISELTWSDRERVLRLLFAKINNSEPMQQMPPHLLDVQDQDTLGMATRAAQMDIDGTVMEGDETFLTTDALEARAHLGALEGQSSHGIAAPIA